MGLKRLEAEHRRLAIIRLLAEDAGYRLNSQILQDALGLYGHDVSCDVVRADIHWLSEQDLVEFESLSDLLVVTLTNRGLDVSQSRATVPGVKRPRPGM